MGACRSAALLEKTSMALYKNATALSIAITFAGLVYGFSAHSVSMMFYAVCLSTIILLAKRASLDLQAARRANDPQRGRTIRIITMARTTSVLSAPIFCISSLKGLEALATGMLLVFSTSVLVVAWFAVPRKRTG